MTTKHDDHDSHPEHPKKPHSDSHADPDAAASTPQATIFSISPTLSAFLATLTPLTDAQVARLRRVSSDVTLALKDGVIQTINDNPALGGPARAARLTALIAQQGKLLDANAVLASLLQLVANNLLAVNAELGDDVFEALKIANALIKTQPELARAMEPAQEWSDSHHAAHHASTKATT